MAPTSPRTSGSASVRSASGARAWLDLARFGLWPLRLVWVAMPAAAGYGLTTTIDHLSQGSKFGIELWWWAAWFVGLVAVLVPNPVSLTVIRMLTPAGLVAALSAGLATGRWTTALGLSLVWSVVAVVAAFLPTVGDAMINGSAYGSERRMVLRPPGYALVAAVPLAGLVATAALVTPPLLMGAGRWWAVVVSILVGAGLVFATGRLLHQLARRWIVFVPAGFVIHDPVALVDAVLFRRSSIAALGPALVVPGRDQSEGAVIDLTGGAMGLALEVETLEATSLTVRDGARSADARLVETTNVTFTPSLPGAALSEARIRGIKIGEAPGATPNTA